MVTVYEKAINFFEESVKAIVPGDKRQRTSRYFFEPEELWRRSLPEICERYGSEPLLDDSVKKLAQFQVDMLR